MYAGNTVEHATKGGSFAHALGYVVLGNKYLLGQVQVMSRNFIMISDI